MVLLPGARQLLNVLPPDRWTIATSCTRPLAEVRLRAAGLPVPTNMITSTDVKIGKPDPEPYLKAAAKLGFAAKDCIVVEDAPAGIRAARAGGMTALGIARHQDAALLRAEAADLVVNSLDEIAVEELANGRLCRRPI